MFTSFASFSLFFRAARRIGVFIFTLPANQHVLCISSVILLILYYSTTRMCWYASSMETNVLRLPCQIRRNIWPNSFFSFSMCVLFATQYAYRYIDALLSIREAIYVLLFVRFHHSHYLLCPVIIRVYLFYFCYCSLLYHCTPPGTTHIVRLCAGWTTKNCFSIHIGTKKRKRWTTKKWR